MCDTEIMELFYEVWADCNGFRTQSYISVEECLTFWQDCSVLWLGLHLLGRVSFSYTTQKHCMGVERPWWPLANTPPYLTKGLVQDSWESP